MCSLVYSQQDGVLPEPPPDIRMLGQHPTTHAIHLYGAVANNTKNTVHQLRSSAVDAAAASDGPTVNQLGLPFGVAAPDMDGTADGIAGGRQGEHHRTDAVPMLLGSHDDDDGGGGGEVVGDNCDLFDMSDFRQFCCDNDGDADEGGGGGGGRKSHLISLSCLDEPLPLALHSLLMELDGAEPDLDALIGVGDIGETGSDGGSGGTGAGGYRLSDELADCWSD